MGKPHAVVLVGANEEFEGEERDLVKAIATRIRAQGLLPDTDYLTYKVLPREKASQTNSLLKGGESHILPLNDADYAQVPALTPRIIDEVHGAEKVTLIGAGHSTLKAIARLADMMKSRVDTSYTHYIDGKEDLQLIVDNDIRLFSTLGSGELVALSPSLAMDVKHVKLDAVPHTNHLVDCEQEAAAFLKGPNGAHARKVLGSGEPYAVVILNAGFEVAPGKYVPYTKDEAREQGTALGNHLPSGTHLFLMHCGPRNLRDEFPSIQKGDQHEPQQTMRIFSHAYRVAQQEKIQALQSQVRKDERNLRRGGIVTTSEKVPSPPLVIEQRYEALGVNPGKAAYILGRGEKCIAFITDSEAFGTMQGALLNVPKSNRLLGMFKFAAQEESDPQLENVRKFNNLGISILHAAGGALIVEESKPHGGKPLAFRDAAEQIVNYLKIAQPIVPGRPPVPRRSRQPGAKR